MATSDARMIRGEEKDASIIRPVFYQKADNASYRPYDWNQKTNNAASDANSANEEVSTFDMNGPAPLGDNLAGLIRQIDHLINSRQSVQAINLASDILAKYGDGLSDFAYERIANKIDDALPYIGIDGTDFEAEEMRRRLLKILNVSSHYDEKLISELSSTGFAQIALSMRSANQTTFEGGTKDTPGFAPNFSLNGAA